MLPERINKPLANSLEADSHKTYVHNGLGAVTPSGKLFEVTSVVFHSSPHQSLEAFSHQLRNLW